MSRLIDADNLKDKFERLPCSYWMQETIQNLIEEEANAGDYESKIIYQAMIPICPKTKKNNQKIIYKKKNGQPMIVQSDAYKQYEKDAGWFLKSHSEPISVPVNIKCTFYRDSERRVDLTNLLEAIDDILVKYKIIKDDNFKILVSHDGSRVLVDRNRPRTEIVIEQIIM